MAKRKSKSKKGTSRKKKTATKSSSSRKRPTRKKKTRKKTSRKKKAATTTREGTAAKTEARDATSETAEGDGSFDTVARDESSPASDRRETGDQPAKPDDNPRPSPPTGHVFADLHIWEFAWLRDILMLAGGLIVLYTLYVLRAIVLPVLVGLTLAYLLNPIVNKLNERYRWPRRVIAGGALATVAGVIALIITVATPLIADQVGNIVQNRERYIQTIREWKQTIERELELVPAEAEAEDSATSMETDPQPRTQPAARAAADGDTDEDAAADNRDRTLHLLPEPRTVFNFVVNSLGIGYTLVSDLIDLTLYLVVFVLVAGMSFFYFSWRFAGIVHWFGQSVPSHHRPRALYIARRMNEAISGFVRGRLIQSAIMAINMGIGLAFITYGIPFIGIPPLCEVPSWPLIALAAGALNLIPYAAVVAWLAAIILAWVGQPPDQTSLFAVLFWPTLVYSVAQFLDGWVIEPRVQSSAVNLSGLTIVLAVLVGGTIGGLLGLMIAIPVAACLKILWEEIWLPQLKHYLEQLP